MAKIIKMKQFGFLGYRHLQAVLLFLMLLVAYGYRSSMSVAIIAMMSDDPPSSDIPTYPDWTLKNVILSSFFWGYVVFQVCAGKLGQRFGSKWFLAYAMLVNAVFALLTPIFAKTMGEGGVIACRVIQGLHQGFLYPNIHNLLRTWTPLSERSRITSFSYTGGILGIVVAMPLTGVISESKVGWPTIFYLYGGAGVLWVIIWAIFGSNSPSEHKFISEEEKHYIEDNLPTNDDERKHVPTPWKDIALSLPMWAILIGHSGQNWNFWTLLTETPSYLSNIMGYDLEDNSLMSAAPYLAHWLLSFVFSFISDILIVRKITSIGWTRKIMQSVGMFIPSLVLFWLGFLDKDQKVLAVTLLIIAVGLNSAVQCAYQVNHIDIAPLHAGVLMGITNSLGNIFSIIAPLVVSAIGISEKDPQLWKIVFWLAAAIGISTDIFFVVFASGEIQYWNNKTPSK